MLAGVEMAAMLQPAPPEKLLSTCLATPRVNVAVGLMQDGPCFRGDEK